ncbi:PRC-barrel domain-containing protein [Rubrobacter marinus]|nr:PRC-barrel domain-containing protein [Rubrobacter marinus]
MDIVDPFAGLKKAKEDYKVYDSHYEKIGKVDDLLVDDRDEVLYVGVKMGLFGTNSTIIPTEIVRVNDKRQLIEVSEPADTIKHAPHFGHGTDLTPELENHVRSYYGLEGLRPSPEHTGDYPVSGTTRASPRTPAWTWCRARGPRRRTGTSRRAPRHRRGAPWTSPWTTCRSTRRPSVRPSGRGSSRPLAAPPGRPESPRAAGRPRMPGG